MYQQLLRQMRFISMSGGNISSTAERLQAQWKQNLRVKLLTSPDPSSVCYKQASCSTKRLNLDCFRSKGEMLQLVTVSVII